MTARARANAAASSTGEVRPVESLVRFVVGPENDIVPDIEGKLPGRGHVGHSRPCRSRKSDGEGRLRQGGASSRDCAVRSCGTCGKPAGRPHQGGLGLARRAGQLEQGYDNVQRALEAKAPPRLLVEAADGAHDGRRKLAVAADKQGCTPLLIYGLSSDELSLALGRANVIHAAVKPGPLAERLLVDSARLNGLRAKAIALGNERNA